MKKSDIAWAAGLYEGEGSCYVNRQRWTNAAGETKLTVRGALSLRIQMTDRDVLERFRDVFGIGRIYGPYRYGTSKKDVWQYCARRGDDAKKILEKIRPWLGERRCGQVDDALADYMVGR